MKKENEVEIILLGNDEKNFIEAIDVNGTYYERKEDEKLEAFLGRATWEHVNKTGVNIFPYLTSKEYDNIYSMRNSSYQLEKKDEEQKRIAASKTKKKQVATGVAAAALSVALVGMGGCKNSGILRTAEKEIDPVVEDAVNDYLLNDKKAGELVKLLDKKSGQRAALKKIKDAQEFFNKETGPSIWIEEDKDAQLYVTEDEVLSTYIYLNILTAGPSKLNEIFGQSNAIWINKAKPGEEPIYERLTKEQIENSFESMAQVLGNYYKWGIEPTGFSNLFEDEDEQEFYAEFENLVLDFNETGSKKSIDKIHNFFGKVYGSKQIDPLYEKYPGACALMARTAVPALRENGVVCEKGFANIMNIYKCEFGDRIEDALTQMFGKGMKRNKLKNNNILDALYKAMDKELMGLNRNIKSSYKVPTECDVLCSQISNCSGTKECGEEKTEEESKTPEYKPENNKRIEGKKRKHKKCNYYTTKKPKIPKYKDKFKSTKKVRKTTKKKTIKTRNRKDVEKKYSEDKIREAEKKANCEDKAKEKNEKENKRADDVKRGNDDAVDYFVSNGGKTGTPSKDESKDYQDQYNETNKDLEEVKKQQEEYDKTHPEKRREKVSEKEYDEDGNERTPGSKDTTGVRRVKSVTVYGETYMVRHSFINKGYTRMR